MNTFTYNVYSERSNDMSKVTWKPGNMIYPVPAAMVTCGDSSDNYNVITIAWTGTICTNPPMTYISVRPSRHSYDLIKRTGEFVINLTTESLTHATDFCGVRSGRDMNKLEVCKLDIESAQVVKAPLLSASPVNIECRVTEIKELGSHHMFLAEVVSVSVDDSYIDDHNKFHLDRSKPICYSHGSYFGLGSKKGTFGYSVAKKKKGKKKINPKQSTNKPIKKKSKSKTQKKTRPN